MGFLSNVVLFLVLTYLASLLAQSLRRKGQELEEKHEELLGLQDFTEDIIHSMRGGLLTTDLEGRILLLNRSGEEILGHRLADLRGKTVRDISGDFWLPLTNVGKVHGPARKEIDFCTPEGKQRSIGISVSTLRSREPGPSDYVFNY